jgi:hypothetical protein
VWSMLSPLGLNSNTSPYPTLQKKTSAEKKRLPLEYVNEIPAFIIAYDIDTGPSDIFISAGEMVLRSGLGGYPTAVGDVGKRKAFFAFRFPMPPYCLPSVEPVLHSLEYSGV